jgi:hypothetical protein
MNKSLFERIFLHLQKSIFQSGYLGIDRRLAQFELSKLTLIDLHSPFSSGATFDFDR